MAFDRCESNYSLLEFYGKTYSSAKLYYDSKLIFGDLIHASSVTQAVISLSFSVIIIFGRSIAQWIVLNSIVNVRM